ncbi:MAG: hypothetical protein HOO08_05475 [Opitutae bacterium]|jgi:hypothetical protein|nr:hypothetical protein [Opitutae bacterium]
MISRIHYPFLQCLPLLVASIAAICLTACDQAQPVSYQIPKEERADTIPTVAAATTQETSAPSKMNVLPGMQQAANAAGEVDFITPDGWENLVASGIRKANLKVTADTGSAEITILTFPGDVGGHLANINRWRGQVGLEAATVEDLPTYTTDYDISGHRGLYVRLEGESQSILGALLPFHGSTWFVKMLGDTTTVLANEASMKQFLDSIQLEDHAH